MEAEIGVRYLQAEEGRGPLMNSRGQGRQVSEGVGPRHHLSFRCLDSRTMKQITVVLSLLVCALLQQTNVKAILILRGQCIYSTDKVRREVILPGYTWEGKPPLFTVLPSVC